jgi:glycosyltransferase involved in cell wall biosynthesis
MRFLFLTSSLEPARDGVGDYALRLTRKLSQLGHHAACIGIHDRHADIFMGPNSEGDSIPYWRFPAHASNRHRMRLLQTVIDKEEPDLLSLQYVPHGFEKRGMPLGLPNSLAALRGGFAWHLMFHELWIGSLRGESLRRKCVGQIQRAIALSLCKQLSPRLIHTSNVFYQSKLAKAGIGAGILPIFSNIPVADPDPEKRLRLLAQAGIREDAPGIRVYVFFGDIHPEWDPSKLLEVASESSKNSLFVSIGKVSDVGIMHWKKMEQNNGGMPRFLMMGELSSSEISRILLASDYGATTEAVELLGKSGSVAAMLEHGLPVISCRSLGTGFNLTDPRFFYPGKTDIPLAAFSRRSPAEALGNVAREFLSSLGLHAKENYSV